MKFWQWFTRPAVSLADYTTYAVVAFAIYEIRTAGRLPWPVLVPVGFCVAFTIVACSAWATRLADRTLRSRSQAQACPPHCRIRVPHRHDPLRRVL